MDSGMGSAQCHEIFFPSDSRPRPSARPAPMVSGSGSRWLTIAMARAPRRRSTTSSADWAALGGREADPSELLVSPSRASRRRRATRTARSAERSGTKASSGTKRRSVREPSSCRRYGLASSSAAMVVFAASSSPSTLTYTRALRRSSVISTDVTVGNEIRGSRSSSLINMPSSRWSSAFTRSARL